MSMIGNFLAVTEADLKSYLDNCDLLAARINDYDSENQNSIDVDKAWQAIHYILTNDPWEGESPESLVILGGQDIGEDFGYGPGKYLTSSEVKMVAEFLKKVDFTKIRAEYDPETFDNLEIYPSVIWLEEKEEALDYVLSFFEPLIEFYANAAKNNFAVVKYIN